MNREKLQLALGIISGRIQVIVTREQYQLLGLEYVPVWARKSSNQRNVLLRHAEDILLEALSEHS